MWSDDFDQDDRDAPQPIDLADGEDGGTIDCPHCGRAIHEDAPRCPYCGDWVVLGSSAAGQQARGWFWPVAVAILIAIMLVMWHGLGR
jgi:predicted RNA-binding Zn-ribbon protein involved in translation (DUF1610 family)